MTKDDIAKYDFKEAPVGNAVVYEFKGKDDPEYQKVLRWKLRLTPFEYLMLRANADYSYSTEFIEEVDKEAERIALEREIVTSKPNLIRYPRSEEHTSELQSRF